MGKKTVHKEYTSRQSSADNSDMLPPWMEVLTNNVFMLNQCFNELWKEYPKQHPDVYALLQIIVRPINKDQRFIVVGTNLWAPRSAVYMDGEWVCTKARYKQAMQMAAAAYNSEGIRDVPSTYEERTRIWHNKKKQMEYCRKVLYWLITGEVLQS